MTDYYFFQEYWWLLALIVLALFLCLKIRGGKQTRCCRMKCSPGYRDDASKEILDKLSARRKINLREFEEIKRAMIIA